MVQDFSYHTHTNTFGLFDGQNSIKEMIDRAKALGWSHMGISNHMVVHPDVKTGGCFFPDYGRAEEIYKRLVDEIRVAAIKENFPVLVGFEVDYFRDPTWEKWFERFVPTLGADYLIGSTHVWGKDATKGFLFFTSDASGTPLPPEEIRPHMDFYFETQKTLIRSGYFTFLAHMDLGRRYKVDNGTDFKEQKEELIEEIIKAQLPVEINTSAFAFGMTEPHPSVWILKELKKADIPVVISDDTHSAVHLGFNFDKAEDLLKNLNYTKRLRLPLQ